MLKRKITLLVAALAISGIVSWSFEFRQYIQQDTVNIHGFPAQFGGWSSTEIKISENDYAILETRNAFSRMYKSAAGDTIYLFVVYSQNNRKVSHPPEICYTGGGATILSKSLRAVTANGQDGIVANRLDVEQGPDQQVMYYWFKVGSSFTPNYWQQQMLIAFKTLLGQKSSSALIRMAVVVQGEDIARADSAAQDFARRIVPALKQYLP